MEKENETDISYLLKKSTICENAYIIRRYIEKVRNNYGRCYCYRSLHPSTRFRKVNTETKYQKVYPRHLSDKNNAYYYYQCQRKRHQATKNPIEVNTIQPSKTFKKKHELIVKTYSLIKSHLDEGKCDLLECIVWVCFGQVFTLDFGL